MQGIDDFRQYGVTRTFPNEGTGSVFAAGELGVRNEFPTILLKSSQETTFFSNRQKDIFTRLALFDFATDVTNKSLQECAVTDCIVDKLKGEFVFFVGRLIRHFDFPFYNSHQYSGQRRPNNNKGC